ncbi:hypothetical protein LCGC14_0660360 [marine sediment metagenome]|uniref:Uncharacterized protein n=1 Tax=marine sediment metagenome TaxID=412755 RepID=A0A0F9U226_9ZZZZ
MLTNKQIKDFPRRIRTLKLDSGWSQRQSIEALAKEAEFIIILALLEPDAGAKLVTRAAVKAALDASRK